MVMLYRFGAKVLALGDSSMLTAIPDECLHFH
jgi:hypothetical protein